MKAAQRQTYRAFIRSPEWADLRRACIARDGAACRRCGSRFNLEVHHLTYIRFGGRELPGDLITLCERCHRRAHAGPPHREVRTIPKPASGMDDGRTANGNRLARYQAPPTDHAKHGVRARRVLTGPPLQPNQSQPVGGHNHGNT